MGGVWRSRKAGTRAVILVTALTVSGAQAEELKCDGPFAREAGHDRLVTAFGQRKVVRETVYGPEGVKFKASVVYPKDRARRLEVIWRDETARRNPASIQFTGSGWTGPYGVHIGMSLSEVEAANGKPFVLHGFGWDYGGWASDWDKGALAGLSGGCKLHIKFRAADDADGAAWLKVIGDHQFSSSSAEIRAVRPRIELISLRYPQEPGS